MSAFELRPRRTRLMRRQIPKPPHRHAAPSGPWPYVDSLEHDQEHEDVIDAGIPAIIGSCGHDNCSDCPNWIAYPQSHFGNWTIKPVSKCGIEAAVRNNEHPSTIYTVDVLESGKFKNARTVQVTSQTKREYYNNALKVERGPGIRVRALFVDNMSGPVLQMLGSTYNIEPFFFSSSINWIPSRYQENPIAKIGDHITVTLTFIRMGKIKDNPSIISTPNDQPKGLFSRLKSTLSVISWLSYFSRQVEEVGNIEVLAPVYLRSSDKIIYPDFLGIHMVRDVKSSTVISYHHDIEGSTTSARDLYTRMKLVGRSVYWQLIVKGSKDSTFAFLAMLWSALYAWDQALEALYEHFSWLETRGINTNDVAITYELHVIRAHLLHYTSLLRDFCKSVEFVRDTANPAMDSDDIDDAIRVSDKALLGKECENLLSEISRLELQRSTLDFRVQNVQRLIYTSVNIEDSKAMKRLSYISMVFLPASFVANAFGMNITELNPGGHFALARFFEASVPLTLLTIWIIVAFQNRFVLRDDRGGMWRKLLWPIVALNQFIQGLAPKKDNYVRLKGQ